VGKIRVQLPLLGLSSCDTTCCKLIPLLFVKFEEVLINCLVYTDRLDARDWFAREQILDDFLIARFDPKLGPHELRDWFSMLEF
jgi:hypothetical protein